MSKCPACGYSNEQQYNPSKKIQELRSERSKNTKKLLRQVINFIQTNVPSDNNVMSEYYFYQSISKINDWTVDWAILRYLANKKPVFSGKGFKYLAAVVNNHHKNRETVSVNERLMMGKPPSRVIIEENEWI